MKQREHSLDILRIISALLVVLAHVYTVSHHTAMKSDVINGAYWYFHTVRYMCELSVPIFIMLSGAFVLASKSTMNVKSFYKKTWQKMGIPTLVFSLIFILEKAFIYVHTGYLKDFENQWLTSFLLELGVTAKGRPADHMWYMFMLIGIYILCPFIVMAKEKMGEKAFKTAAWVVWIWGTVSNLITKPEYYWTLGFCINMLGIFMLGYVAHEWGKNNKGKISGWMRLFAAIAIMLAYNAVATYFHELGNILGATSPYAPAVGISAFFIVEAFSSFDIKVNIWVVSALVLLAAIIGIAIAVYFPGAENMMGGVNPFAPAVVISMIVIMPVLGSLDIKNAGIISASTYWVYLTHPLFMDIVFIAEEKLFGIPYLANGVNDYYGLPNVSYIIIVALSFAAAVAIERIVNASLYVKKTET